MEPISVGKTLVEATLKEVIPSLLKKIKIELGHVINNRILEYEVTEFNRNYFSKSILNRTEPVPLPDYYMPLFINPMANKYNRISTLSLKTLFETTNNNITLFGDAGSGKSTLVKHLFIDCIHSKYKIPIKIELRFLSIYNGTLIDYIKLEIFKLQKLAQDDGIIDRLLGSGDFLLFLDGYDEIKPSEKDRVTRDIDNLVKAFPENKYFLTTRPFTKIELLTGFSNYEVCGFKNQDIEAFIHKQSSVAPELANEMIALIKRSDTKHFSEFFSNPLLLTMFILTFRRYKSIPEKRSMFYSYVFNTLYTEHDELSKQGFIRTMRSGLNRDACEKILKWFSCLSYFESRFSFDLDYINTKLSEIKKGNYNFDNRDFIADLETAIGVFYEDGFDYKFLHRSMQEYFAAKYIVEMEPVDRLNTYNTLLLKITNKQKKYLSDNKNFFIILMELDTKYMLKCIIQPALKNIFARINNEKDSLFSNTLETKVLDYNDELELIIDNFLLSNNEFNIGELKLLKDSTNGHLEWDDESYSGARPYNIAKISINYFMENYNRWLLKLNEIIDGPNGGGIIAVITKS